MARPSAKLYPVALSAIFILVTLTGFIGTFIPYDSVPGLQELRRLAPFPSRDDLHHPTELPGRISSFFADNFGGRKFLIRDYFRFRLHALHADVGLPAILGKGGWLIRAEEVPFARRTVVLRPDETNKMSTVLNAWCKYSQARGATMVFLIAPDKTTIYPVLPAYLPPTSGPSVIDTVYALPLDCPVIKVDLRSTLRQHSDTPLYYKWGIHWNNRAALLAWEEIKRAVEESGHRFRWPRPMMEMLERPAAPHEDSSWMAFGLKDPERLMVPAPVYKGSSYPPDGEAGLPRAKILAFGDSFLLFMEPTAHQVLGNFAAWNHVVRQGDFKFEAGDLGKDGWIIPSAYQKPTKAIDAFRPNIVVVEIVEQGIQVLAGFPLPPDSAVLIHQ